LHPTGLFNKTIPDGGRRRRQELLKGTKKKQEQNQHPKRTIDSVVQDAGKCNMFCWGLCHFAKGFDTLIRMILLVMI
jgi:hypothetical protein